MRYTVIWVPSALDELARLWLQSPNQQAVADAADEIDRLLRSSPESQGEEWEDGRYLAVPPLEVVFSVSPDDRMVRVLRVALLP